MEVRSQDRQVDQPTDANAGWRGQNRLTARRISNHESFDCRVRVAGNETRKQNGRGRQAGRRVSGRQTANRHDAELGASHQTRNWTGTGIGSRWQTWKPL